MVITHDKNRSSCAILPFDNNSIMLIKAPMCVIFHTHRRFLQ